MAQVRDHREQGAEKKMSKGQRPNRTDGKKKETGSERERERDRENPRQTPPREQS